MNWTVVREWISPVAAVVGILMSGVMAYVAMRMDLRLAKFKDELLQTVNDNFLHKETAVARFDGLDRRIDDLRDDLREGREHRMGR